MFVQCCEDQKREVPQGVAEEQWALGAWEMGVS